METLGHHVNTPKGREILRTFGGLLTTEQIKTDTEFQVKSTKLRIPGQKDMDGRIRRPYLDMDVEVTGMVVDNEGSSDAVHFPKQDRSKMRYRYELDDHELQDLISRGMYRDRSFERDLAHVFYNQPFIDRTNVTVHTTKVNYDGIAVPYVLVDNVDTLLVDYAESRENQQVRSGFSVAFDDAMLMIDKADQLAVTTAHNAKAFDGVDSEFESDRTVALTQLLDGTEDYADQYNIESNGFDETPEDEVVEDQPVIEDPILAQDVNKLSESLDLPEELPVEEPVVEQPKEDVVEDAEPEHKKTLKERLAEMESEKQENVSRETDENVLDDDFEF